MAGCVVRKASCRECAVTDGKAGCRERRVYAGCSCGAGGRAPDAPRAGRPARRAGFKPVPRGWALFGLIGLSDLVGLDRSVLRVAIDGALLRQTQMTVAIRSRLRSPVLLWPRVCGPVQWRSSGMPELSGDVLRRSVVFGSVRHRS